MDSLVFQNINKIIERDSKATTYKFALLRGVIDIIQDNSPFITLSNDRVIIPTGLLIEKWLLYYFPILEASTPIPQINGTANLAFEFQFRKIIRYYKLLGGFSAFYNDLKNKGIPDYAQADFLILLTKMHNTITSMPMKHIGFSISNELYSIFRIESKMTRKLTKIDFESLIYNFGKFSIPEEYYEAFQVLGSFINGQDSILFKWAEFSVNASRSFGQDLSIEKVVNEVLKNPITEREVAISKHIYKNILDQEGKVYCAWTGKAIRSYHIDHMIPFAVWKNNDLWNLLPVDVKVNSRKRDKIPTEKLIERRKDMIIYYWDLINNKHSERFKKEIQLTLLGEQPFSTYQTTAIQQLQKKCHYFIFNRGFEEWNGEINYK